VGAPEPARRLPGGGRDLSRATPLTARVVPDVTGLDKTFDYLVPPELASVVGPGTIVRVPLHGRRVGGWVLSVGSTPPDVPVEKLKPLAKVTGHGPGPDLVELAQWAALRWGVGRVRPFLRAASPPGAVPVLPPARRGPAVPEPVDERAAGVLQRGGGVLRLPPAADPLGVVLAACRLGPTLVASPSQDAARLLVARLRRTGREVALVPGDWASAAGGVDVVVGARAAAWAPCAGLAAVVVLDEHDEALQEERSPTWHARDVLVERARRAAVPALVVSPCPSLAALEWAAGRFSRPSVDDERAGWPLVEIVDRTRDEPWHTSLVTSALVRQLRDPARRVVCVLNTRGRSRLLACRQCRALLRCERCGAAVRQHDDTQLHCGRCGTVRPGVCQACGSTALANRRPGVSRLREELEAAAGRPVVAVTGDLDQRVPIPVADVYVGTEAVLHRVPRADTVAFLDLDAELLAPRYRAGEQAMALLARAARLVGARSTGGRLLVQTFLPRHEVLQAVLLADPGRYASAERERRAQLGFPPVTALAVVEGSCADQLAEALRADARVRVAGPADGAYLVRAATWDELGAALVAAPRAPGSRVRIEVDPPRR
jgi:primosomal protein N' (replication factor Y)